MQYTHFRLEKVQPLSGYTVEAIEKGEVGKIMVRTFLHSDMEEFHNHVNFIYSLFIGTKFKCESISNFLIIHHQDHSADVYINNLNILCKVRSKGEIEKDKLIAKCDIFDIDCLYFPDIEIKNTDAIVFCFRIGWKFGLFFDLLAFNGKELNTKQLYSDLGKYHQFLTFYSEYSIISNSNFYNILIDNGWFPFIQLIGNDYEQIANFYKDENIKVRGQVLSKFIDKFDSNRLESFTKYWWKNELFAKKKKIITAGINAYLQRNDEGYINCIKTIYSEIEGIIRILYFNEINKDPSFTELKKYIANIAKSEYSAKSSLTFPTYFYDYIDKSVFMNFNLRDAEIDLSRHTSSHGVADPEKYTRERALQAILILDQIHFYLLGYKVMI